MNTYKKLFSFFLVLLITFTACGCKKNNDNNNDSSYIEEIIVYEEYDSSADTTVSDTSGNQNSSTTEETKPESFEKPDSKESKDDISSEPKDDVNIDKTIPGQNALAISMYHFNIGKTVNYDGTEYTRFDELEDVFYNGYCNNIILSVGDLQYDKITNMLIKYNVSFWISAWNYFDSKYTTIEDYLAKFSYLDEIKDNKQLWDLFLGFHFDENIWRGQSNADFLTMTNTENVTSLFLLQENLQATKETRIR